MTEPVEFTAPDHPVPLNKEYAEGRNLEPMPPWPETMTLRPMATHRQVMWYSGPMLSAIVYEASDGTLTFEALPYDQHVRVLAGTVILTSTDGSRNEFAIGDSFVAPKGWSGTWELKDGAREEIVFETAALQAAMKDIFSA